MNAMPNPPVTPPVSGQRKERLRANPVLIKELRQGMRSKLYTIVFMAIQVIMLFYLLLITSIEQTRGSGELEFVFWWLIGLFLLVCLPLTGANALSSETRGSRLELLLLTGISSRRIVFGKWLAIVAQGMLLATALLPYLVLRYYIDSAEFHESLLYIFLMFVSSAVLTGITVSLSVIRTGILRWSLLVFGVIFVMPGIISSLVMYFSHIGSLYAELPALLLMGILIVSLCMEFASTRFNPIEENHDTAKRLILWAMVAISMFSYWQNADFALPYGVTIACFTIVAWDGLCRKPSGSPTIYEPFVRLGWFGRLAGRFLYPGWISAVWFNLLTLVLISAPLILTMFSDEYSWKALWYVILFVGIIAFPFALALLTRIGQKRTGLTMFIIQLVLVLAAVLMHLVDKAVGSGISLAISWIPTSALLLDGMGDVVDDPANALYMPILVGTVITTAASLAIILIKSASHIHLIRDMQRQASINIEVRKANSAVAPEDTIAAGLANTAGSTALPANDTAR